GEAYERGREGALRACAPLETIAVRRRCGSLQRLRTQQALLELRANRCQLGFQLTRTGLGPNPRLLELLASRLLGRNGAIDLVAARGSALGVGVEAAPLVALVRQLLLQPRGRRERLVSLNKGRRDAVVTVERRTGAPVGQREPPLVEQLLTDRERVEPSPPLDPHQPLALRTGERRLCERCRHAAGRRRLSVAVAQRKAQSSKRGAV